MDTPDVRNVVHLHGAHVLTDSDGYPEFWYTPDPDGPPNGLGGPAGNFANYHYPNSQEPTSLWYHDHALGITRLNVYTGLAGSYLIRDEAEEHLNLPKGKYEVPLLIQDRSFNTDGSLFYPSSGQGDPNAPPVWVPEWFADTVCVNGKVWPYLNVEPRKYRFRVLNGSGSRFYHLAMDNGRSFWQIGTDGGLLEAPVRLTSLLIAPAERADLIVDFSGHAGQTITVTNDAATPYPDGGDDNDPANNPDMTVVMQFKVTLPLAGHDTSRLPARLGEVHRLPPSSAVKIRKLTLNEALTALDSPIRALLGTLRPDGTSNPLPWEAPVTENPRLGTTEIWSFTNLTGDTHPIHMHLVQFEILDRQALVLDPDTGEPTSVPDANAPRVPPDPNEAGRKDTVRVNPGTVTRVIAHFDLPGRFVWHCHILEHEDNDMMRPFDVIKGGDGK